MRQLTGVVLIVTLALMACGQPTPKPETTPEALLVVEPPCPQILPSGGTIIDDYWKELIREKAAEVNDNAPEAWDWLSIGAYDPDPEEGDVAVTVSLRVPEGECWPGNVYVHMYLKNLPSGGCAVVGYGRVFGSHLCLSPVMSGS